MDVSLESFLNCPCTHFAPAADAAPILDAYWKARARGAQEGFTPLLLPAEDEHFLETLTFEEYRDMEAYRRELLAAPPIDGGAWLARRAEEYRRMLDGAEPDDPGPMEGGEASDSFSAIWDYGSPRRTIPLVLAELPAKNPWEVFAWTPFGGWNECPAPEEQVAVAKYWFEKYGAVPGVMTMDVLEYTVPAPVGREAAMELAQEQYAFCPDIVDQGCGSVGLLADILSKSTTWFFWWD